MLLGGFINSYGQIITITEKEANEPLELVTLLSESPKIYVATNAKGQADLSGFTDSEKIAIQTFGHKIVVKSYAQLKADNFKVAL